MACALRNDDWGYWEAYTPGPGDDRHSITINLPAEYVPFGILQNIDGDIPAQIEVGEVAGSAHPVSIEGWQLALAVLVILSGSYTFTWLAFTRVDDSLGEFSRQNSAAAQELASAIREEMAADRAEAARQFEIVRQDMADDRRTSTNLILDLQKQQGRLKP